MGNSKLKLQFFIKDKQVFECRPVLKFKLRHSLKTDLDLINFHIEDDSFAIDSIFVPPNYGIIEIEVLIKTTINFFNALNKFSPYSLFSKDLPTRGEFKDIYKLITKTGEGMLVTGEPAKTSE